MHKTLTTIIALTLSSGITFAGEKEFDNTKLAIKAAEKTGLYNLAMRYQEGNGCKTNPTLAKKYFTLSAQQGNSEAQYMLGNIYRKELNFEKAFEMYHKSAMQNHFWGLYYLGKMYLLGEGVKADPKMAFKWLKKAAQQGTITGRHDV